MSKLATFAVSVTLAASDEPENDQIDFGPFLSNVNGLFGANTTSPGDVTIVQLAAGPNPQTCGPFQTANVAPMYFALQPLQQTSGSLALLGANSDTGVAVSSVNPSFVPVLPTAPNPDAPTFVSATVIVQASGPSPAKVSWA